MCKLYSNLILINLKLSEQAQGCVILPQPIRMYLLNVAKKAEVSDTTMML